MSKNPIKSNIIFCVKVTGETFSLLKLKKKNRRGKILKVLKLSGKRTVTGQNSGESLYKKAPTGQLLIFRKTLTELTKRIIS